jgi:hypothetical protein
MQHLEVSGADFGEKNGDYAACLKYSVPIFVE